MKMYFNMFDWVSYFQYIIDKSSPTPVARRNGEFRDFFKTDMN